MRHFKVFSVLFVMIFLLAACGSDDPDEEIAGSLDVDSATIEDSFDASTFDISDIYLIYTDAQGNESTIVLDESMLDGETPQTEGEHELSVEYQGHTLTFSITLQNHVEAQLLTLYDMGVSEGLIDEDSYEDWLESIKGEDGRGIDSLAIENRELIVSFDDGQTENLGIIVPSDPRSINQTSFEDGVLIIEYDDDSIDEIDLHLDEEDVSHEGISDVSVNDEGYLVVHYADGSEETLSRIAQRDIEFEVIDGVLMWRYEGDEWQSLQGIDDWVSEEETVTVTLKYLDDYIFDEFSIRKGESFVSDGPSMIGFNFNGWAADRDGSERVSPKTPVYEDVVLHAHFLPDETLQNISFSDDTHPYIPLDEYAVFTPNNFEVSGNTLIIPDKVMNQHGEWLHLGVISEEAFMNDDNIQNLHVLSQKYLEIYDSAFRSTTNLEQLKVENLDDLTLVLRDYAFKDTPALQQDLYFPTDTNFSYLRDFETVHKTVDNYGISGSRTSSGQLRLFVTYNIGGIDYYELNAPDDDRDNIESYNFTSNRRDEIEVRYNNASMGEGSETFELDVGFFSESEIGDAVGVFQNSGIKSFSIVGEYEENPDAEFAGERFNYTVPSDGIPDWAFAGASNLEFIRLPDPEIRLSHDGEEFGSTYRYSDIGAYAFKGTDSLESFNFDYFGRLGHKAFMGSGLQEANFHLDIENREGSFKWLDLSNASYAFKDSKIEVVRFATGEEAVPEGFFMNTQYLEEVEIPIPRIPDPGLDEDDLGVSLTRFEARAFKNSNISEIDFPTRARDTLTLEDVTYIGEEAFANTQFEHIAIAPDTVVKDGAFRNIEPLVTFEWQGEVSLFPNHLLANTPNLESVIFPDNVETIGEGAFEHSGLEHITIPSSVQTIDDRAFKGSQINEITFDTETQFRTDQGRRVPYVSANLTNIGAEAFKYTEELLSIHLPRTFNDQSDNATNIHIGREAFMRSAIEDFDTDSEHLSFDDRGFVNANIQNFTWPGQAEEIPSGLFFGTEHLEDFTLPEGIVSIGSTAFRNSGIESFTVQSTVEEIGREAFRGAPIETLEFEDDSSLVSIGRLAFADVEAPMVVEFPSTLETLGEAAFNSSNVQSVTFNGNNLTTISRSAFSNATELESVVFNPGLEVIEETAFRATENLRSVTWQGNTIDPQTGETLAANNFTTIERSAFSQSGIETIELPHSLQTIGTSAFSATNLIELSIPENVEYIGTTAFRASRSLESLIFEGNEIDTISRRFIADTDALESLTLPVTINSIDAEAFEDSDLLELRLSPTLLGKMDAFMEELDQIEEIRFFPTIESEETHFPALFRNHPTLRKINVPLGIETMDIETFMNADNLEEVSLPWTLDRIPSGAFAQTPSLEAVQLGGSSDYGISTIGDNAFYGSNIETIVLNDTLETIEAYAFKNTDNLTNFDFDSDNTDLTMIEDHAFENSALDAFEMPESLQHIGNYAFKNTALTTIEIDQPLELGEYIFEGSDLETVTYLIDTMPRGIFKDAEHLHTVDFGDNPTIEQFAPYAFGGANSLTEFTFPESIIETGEKAFKDALNLEEVDFNAALEVISTSAFEGATSLTHALIPDHQDPEAHSLTHVETRAFKDTTSLQFFFYGEHLEYIGDSAFENSNLNPSPNQSPQTLRHIGNRAFTNSNITEFHVDEYLMHIGNEAFKDTQLDTLTFNETHEGFTDYEGSLPDEIIEGLYLGEYAFSQTLLENVELPWYVMGIGEGTFKNTESLHTVDFNDAANLFMIDNQAFKNTDLSAETLTLPNTLMFIGDEAFANIGDVQHVDIPFIERLEEMTDDGITRTSMGEGIFKDNTIESAHFNRAEFIPDAMFKNNDTLETVTFNAPERLTSIGAYAFNRTNIDAMPDLKYLESIGDYAFEGTLIESFNASKNLETIGDYAFTSTSLETFNVDLNSENTNENDGLIIGAMAFADTLITSFEADIQSFGSHAFYNSDLEVLTITNDDSIPNLPEAFRRIGDRHDPFLETNLLGIIVEEEIYHLYEESLQWEDYFDIIEYEN